LAIYTLSCILCDLLKKNNILPHRASGYSSGFYAAAYAAGSFEFAQGLDIVKQAGEILLDEGQNVDGGMAVIFGISVEKVREVCRQIGDVDLAIMNTPRQTIISGPCRSVKKAIEFCLKQDALDAYFLPVSTAYHSRFMKEATTRFFDVLKEKEFEDPQIELFSYSTLAQIKESIGLKRALAHQLSRPVLWTDLIAKLGNGSNTLLYEVGPGAIIARSVRWIDRHIKILNTSNKERLLNAIGVQ
jgi:malonyl CoA-acyl carrier protein transacylase